MIGRSISAVPAAQGPLLPALAASIALHAALLAGMPDAWTLSPDAARAPLNARLVGDVPGTAREAETARPPETASPQAAREPKPAPPPKPAGQQRGAVRPASSTPPTASPVSEEPPAEVAPAQVAAAAPVPIAGGMQGGATPGEPSNVPRPGEDALDPGTVAQYRLALISTAKRHRLYPPYAIERGWEGRAEVRIVIGADGELVEAVVKRSSGHEVLDRHAIEMLRKAKPLTPLPPALRNREFTLDVPVVYELASK